MLRLTIILAGALALAVADQYPACDVVSTGTLNDVTVTGCSPGARCTVHRGQSLPFVVDFTPSRNSATLHVGVYGILPGIPLPLPFIGFDTNGCNPAYNIQCPLTASTIYKYNNTVHVPTAVITPLNVQAKMQLSDDSGATIGCFLVDLRIES